MSDNRTNIRRNADSFVKQNPFPGYSKVVVVVSEELEYTAGTDTGRTLTVSTPWGTQAMAENILRKVRGFQYRPYTVDGALLDPAAEIGDALTVSKLYSGIFEKNVSYGPILKANLAAPGGEDINYKYEYKSPTDREIVRQRKETKASLKILTDRIDLEVEERKEQGETFKGQLEVQSQQISAKVSKTGGDNSNFGWELTDSSWRILSNGSEILRATREGLEIKGIIRATGGKIGGFDIRDNYLSYNQTWGGTNTYGIYIGQEGIQCGGDGRGVQITANGDLYAENGHFRGRVDAGNIEYGGDAGRLSGHGIDYNTLSGNRLEYNTVGTSYVSSGINTSLGQGEYAYDCAKGYTSFEAVRTGVLSLTGHYISRGYVTDKNGTRKKVLLWD